MSKLLVIVALRRRFQHRQPAFHRQPGRHHQNIFGKAGVLRIGHLVQDVPGNHHRHDDGLAGAGRHLAALADKVPAVAGDLNSHPLGCRRFGQPDQRLDRLQLAEEKAAASNSSGSRQCSSRRLVMLLTPDSLLRARPPRAGEFG